MKTKLVLLALFLPFAARAEVGAWQKDYDVLLKKYVSGSGVRYSAWKASAADVAALGKVVEAIGAENPSGLGRNDKLAFYINAYNAWMIHLVLEKYPIKSVREYAALFGIFTGKNIRLGGEKISLNHLEKDLILKGIGEPRAHFAVNCASRSCPMLIPAAYNGATLDKVLDERAKAFTSNPLGAQLAKDGKTAQLSSIFKWYADDFKPAGGAVAFINKFRAQPLPAGVKVEFQ
ncbi:MAG: DUF547 domain-containing protein, partial [Chthoniobacteraceae bacterium]